MTRELKRFILTVKALARSAEVNGLSPKPLIRFYHDLEGFYCTPLSGVPNAGREVQELLDHLKIKLELKQSPDPTPASTVSTSPPADPPPPRVLLSGPEKIRPSSARKDVLSQAQYNVVQTLLAAGEAGLGKDDLNGKAAIRTPRILKRLYESDPDWELKSSIFLELKASGIASSSSPHQPPPHPHRAPTTPHLSESIVPSDSIGSPRPIEPECSGWRIGLRSCWIPFHKDVLQ